MFNFIELSVPEERVHVDVLTQCMFGLSNRQPTYDNDVLHANNVITGLYSITKYFSSQLNISANTAAVF